MLSVTSGNVVATFPKVCKVDTKLNINIKNNAFSGHTHTHTDFEFDTELTAVILFNFKFVMKTNLNA